MRRTVLIALCALTLVAMVAGVTLGCDSPASEVPAGEAGEEGLHVLPFPGTPDASPQSRVIFLDLASADLGNVIVEGSESGLHFGKLAALENGRGTVFAPETDFAAGERVSVRAELAPGAAAAAAKAATGTEIAFEFTVATPPIDGGTNISLLSGQSDQSVNPPTISFHSRPDLQPPVVTVSETGEGLEPGYVFADAQLALQNGPMILDSRGELVWFKPLPAGIWALDFRVQRYQTEPVLTWWQGEVLSSGYGRGEGVIVDESYRTVATVRAGAGYEADAHEFLLTDAGTALLTIYEPVQAGLTSVGGPQEGIVLDSIIQEVDVETGQVLWEWHAWGHVPFSASYASTPTAGKPWDYFHINSIQETADGDLLVSARNTWAVYRLNRGDGSIVWQLGGKGSSFRMRPGTQFEWQHDARLQPDGTLTLFDNASSPQQKNESRALRLLLDEEDMTARLADSYTHTPPLLAGSQGNTQVLPGGGVFVGWGDRGCFSEFTADGSMVFDASLPPPVQSYRAYRFPWVGLPAEAPSLAVVEVGAGRLTVYASWNGATEVARWEVLAGATPERLSPKADVAATGFETVIPIADAPSYLAVRALTDSGQVLGTSDTVSR